MTNADPKPSTVTFRACKNCKFYHSINAISPANGQCRRNSPNSPIAANISTEHARTGSFFPMVGADLWCGDFKPHPDAAQWKPRTLTPNEFLEIDQYQRLRVIVRPVATNRGGR